MKERNKKITFHVRYRKHVPMIYKGGKKNISMIYKGGGRKSISIIYKGMGEGKYISMI